MSPRWTTPARQPEALESPHQVTSKLLRILLFMNKDVVVSPLFCSLSKIIFLLTKSCKFVNFLNLQYLDNSFVNSHIGIAGFFSGCGEDKLSVADPDSVGFEPFWSDPDPINCPDPVLDPTIKIH